MGFKAQPFAFLPSSPLERPVSKLIWQTCLVILLDQMACIPFLVHQRKGQKDNLKILTITIESVLFLDKCSIDREGEGQSQRKKASQKRFLKTELSVI